MGESIYFSRKKQGELQGKVEVFLWSFILTVAVSVVYESVVLFF